MPKKPVRLLFLGIAIGTAVEFGAAHGPPHLLYVVAGFVVFFGVGGYVFQTEVAD